MKDPAKLRVFRFLGRILWFLVGGSLVVTGAFAEEPVVNRILLIDDFNDGTMVNLLAGGTQGDEEFPGGCIPSFVSAKGHAFGRSGKSLRLEYDVALPGSFSFYWTKSGPSTIGAGTSQPLDLTGYRYLSFWLKASQEKPKFSVEIHQDLDGDDLFILSKDVTSKLLMHVFLRTEDARRWNKVFVPLERFRQINDWAKILEVVFVFENRVGSGRGTLLIDDLLFGTTEPVGEALLPIDAEETLETFTLNGQPVGVKTISLKGRNQLDLRLKEVPASLERIHFDASYNGGKNWRILKNFYDHTESGRYTLDWTLPQEKRTKRPRLRVMASNIAGEDTFLAGPLEARG